VYSWHSMIRILLVTGVRLYREGLTEALGRHTKLEVAGATASGTDTVRLLDEVNPHLVLIDVGTEESIQTISAVAAHSPGVKVVALGVSEEPAAVLRCVEAGAAAYVPREATLLELTSTLEAAARGEVVCSPQVAATLFRRVAALAASTAPAPVSGLTQREREILALIEHGYSNKEIARQLRVKVTTVKNHVHHILEKLGVSRRGAAAKLARSVLGD
jgi:two-component system, NarL family, nitrate/nitrite response regulator NarL